jgi:nicotinate phosphoribosyltransferase
VPLNIVIKIASASGRKAVKISDNMGKNTGDKSTVEEVKQRLGYTEKTWAGVDESTRWGTADQKPAS